MTTYPPPAIQIGMLQQEIMDLQFLQHRHEKWTRQTNDDRVHTAHMRVASALEQTIFEMENSLMTALESIAGEGRNAP
jgi:hypothetical protein